MSWIKEVHKDLEKYGISYEDIENIEVNRINIVEVSDLCREKQNKKGVHIVHSQMKNGQE